MKKKALAIVAATAFAISAFGAPALADKGGDPNDNACHGQIVAKGLSITIFGNTYEILPGATDGWTPADYADAFGITAGQWNKALKELCEL